MRHAWHKTAWQGTCFDHQCMHSQQSLPTINPLQEKLVKKDQIKIHGF
jgi:hypothetical protein